MYFGHPVPDGDLLGAAAFAKTALDAGNSSLLVAEEAVIGVLGSG